MPEKRIQDLMLDLGTLERISPQTRLAEAVKRLDEKRHSLCPPFLLVVDEAENEVVGILLKEDLFKEVLPATQPEASWSRDLQ